MKPVYATALFPLAFLPTLVTAQLAVNSSQSPANLVQNVLLGGGVSVSNITFNGGPANTPNVQAASFNSSSANVGLSTGILLCTGDAAMAIGPNNNSGATLPQDGLFGGGDVDLAALAGGDVFDAAVLEFDFVPSGGQISFDFVFASEEYIEYVGQGFNDRFGFFLSGPGINGPYSNNSVNIALVPGTSTPVAIDNVNPFENPGFYVDNGDGWTAPYNTSGQYIQFDGFTTPLTASHAVQCGQSYHIKLAIADAGDPVLDSGVFLEAGAFASPEPTLTLNDLSVPCMTETTVNLDIDGGTAPYDVVWTLNGNTVGTGSSLTLTADASTTYQVSVTDGCGGTVTGDVDVNVVAPEVNVPAALDIACGDQGALQMDLGPNGDAGLTLVWTANGMVMGNTTSIAVPPPAQPTWYVATITDACGGSGSDSTLVTSSVPPITITMSPNVQMPCDGTGATISVTGVSGSTGSLTYAWTNNGTPVGSTQQITVGPQAGQYNVTVTDGCGATATGTVNVSAQTYPDIVITTTGDALVACPGMTASASVTGVSGGTGNFTAQVWTDADGATVTTADSFTTEVNGDQAYTVTVTDHCGHTGTAQVVLAVQQYAPLTIHLPNAAVCEGGSRELIATATGGAGGYTYLWPAFPEADSAVTVSPETPTTYFVNVTDQCGVAASADAHVTIEYPVSTIVAESIGYNDFAFSTNSLPEAVQYAWDFGDGHTGTDARPEHAYAEMQLTTVTVHTWTANGCPATDTIVLTPGAQLFFPNAFTPDGDGINDVFGAVGLLLDEFELLIFNRWGEQVAAVSGPGATWDGRANGGSAAPDGVYVYSFRAAGNRLAETKGIGHVTLLGNRGVAN